MEFVLHAVSLAFVTVTFAELQTETELQCVECGDPPVVLGARASTNALAFTFPARANYTCLPNMHYVRGVTWSLCQRNGSWTVPDILCSSRTCFYWRDDKAVYTGDQHRTQSGQLCQAWGAQSPHEHNRHSIFRFTTDHSMEELGSRCRDPDGEAVPWCYTLNPRVRWEVCNVPTCLRETCGEPPALLGATVLFNATSDPYTAHYACAQGFRRRRGGSRGRCLFDGAWQQPSLLCVPSECYRVVAGFALYWGNASETKNGSLCQRWDQQVPHAHNFRHDSSFAVDGGVAKADNFCRDPSGSGRPWCYIESAQLFWDFCDVPQCPDTLEEEGGCGSPPSVDNATLFFTSTTEGATAYYKCLVASKNTSGETTLAVCEGGRWSLDGFSCNAATNATVMGDETTVATSSQAEECRRSSPRPTLPTGRRPGKGDVRAYVSLSTFVGVLVPLVVLAAVLVAGTAVCAHRRAKMLRRGDAAFSNIMYLDRSSAHI